MKKQFNLSVASRKLSLSKRTVSNLSSSTMSRVIGGGHTATCGNSCCCGHTLKDNCGGNSKNCTQNQNTCPGHATCYTC